MSKGGVLQHNVALFALSSQNSWLIWNYIALTLLFLPTTKFEGKMSLSISHGTCPQDPSYPCFSFIIHSSSHAMHCDSGALCSEGRGVALPASHLHKVKFWLLKCFQCTLELIWPQRNVKTPIICFQCWGMIITGTEFCNFFLWYIFRYLETI